MTSTVVPSPPHVHTRRTALATELVDRPRDLVTNSAAPRPEHREAPAVAGASWLWASLPQRPSGSLRIRPSGSSTLTKCDCCVSRRRAMPVTRHAR